MVKKLVQHGNSAALIMDKSILDLLKIKFDTPLEITTDGKNLIISPQSTDTEESDVLLALEKVNHKFGRTLKRLGE
jgi:antitoxin component of MazEF toxin-antitoxin module